MGTFLSTFLADSAEIPELADRVRSPGPVPLSSPLTVGDLAADSIAATKLMASLLHLVRTGVRDPKASDVPQVRIAPQLVAGAYRRDQLFRWNGNPALAWAPLSGFFASTAGSALTLKSEWFAEARALRGPPCGALLTSSELASWKDDRMENSQLSGLSVFASGVWPVEISAGKRINAVHRVPVRASVDVATGEVRFHVDSEGIDILRRDSDQR